MIHRQSDGIPAGSDSIVFYSGNSGNREPPLLKRGTGYVPLKMGNAKRWGRTAGAWTKHDSRGEHTFKRAVVKKRKKKNVADSDHLLLERRVVSSDVNDWILSTCHLLHLQREKHVIDVHLKESGARNPLCDGSFNVFGHRAAILIKRGKVETQR